MTIKELDNIKIFFIIGRPRSGTTLLRTLFDAHKNVNIPYEGRVITDLFFKYHKTKNWIEPKLLSFYNDLLKTDKVQYWELNNKLKQDILNLSENATFERLIKVVYLNFVSLFPKDEILLIGDKNPFYSIRKSYLKILKNQFPNAKFIHLTRDYRAQYLSMINMDFENPHPGVSAFRWKYSFKITSNIFQNSKNYLKIKHEELTKNPKVELNKLCTFLNIEYYPELLEFYKIKDKAIEKHGEGVLKVHYSLFNPISDEFSYKWQTKLDANKIKYLDMSVGKIANEAGYERLYEQEFTKLKTSIFKFHTFLFLFYAHILDYVPLNYKRYFLSISNKLAAPLSFLFKK